jgi:hypothetical protein
MRCPNPPASYQEQPRFYTSKGWLTPYGLACGYIHNHTTPSGISTSFWMEHGAIHVRQHDHRTGTRVLWDTFIPSEGPGQWTAARRRYALAVKEALKIERSR